MHHFLLSAAIGFGALASSVTAFAEPAKIIILRHGEKEKGNPYVLCGLGTRRAEALAKQFLGPDAKDPMLLAACRTWRII
jgi:hypothetical protein